MIEQRATNERKHSADDVAAETLCRQRTARIAMIHISQVIERRQVHGINAHRREPDPETRHDPVHVAELRPAEPEEPDGEERGLDACEIQADFGVVGGFLRHRHVGFVFSFLERGA